MSDDSVVVVVAGMKVVVEVEVGSVMVVVVEEEDSSVGGKGEEEVEAVLFACSSCSCSILSWGPGVVPAAKIATRPIEAAWTRTTR